MSEIQDQLGLRERARREMERRMASERGRYYTPNGGIERFLAMVDAKTQNLAPGKTLVFILEAGNGVGKSSLAANVASYMTGKYANKYFDQVGYLRNFRRPNRGRILTTATAAETAYDEELAKWLPAAGFRASKNGHNFRQGYSILSTQSNFDILTFKQDPMEGESVTLDWAIVDEPCTRRHFTALKSRFRFGGIIFIILTPLEGAAWMQHQLMGPDRLNRDVFHMRLSAEENCTEHGVRGLMPHAALEAMWADFDEDELAARRDGMPLALAGSIYKTFRASPDGHVLDVFPDYYQECWDKKIFTLYQTIDPHDRKPWAITWRACFPNGSSFAVAEWPDESMRPFHKIKSWGFGYNGYAKLTIATEKSLGKEAYATIFDPNYAPSAAMNAEGVTSIAAEFLRSLQAQGVKERRFIFPSDQVTEGHLLVKNALGDPAHGVTPEMYWLAHLRNGVFGMTNYGYKEAKNEAKGLSEIPELQFKDFPDTERYFKAAQARYIDPAEMGTNHVDFATPMRRYSGASR